MSLIGLLVLSLSDEDRATTKPQDIDPSVHVLESTFGQAIVDPSLHSKTGWRERIFQRQRKKRDEKNNKFENKIEKEVKMIEDAGLFCCDCRHPDTHDRCVRQFLVKSKYQQHKANVESGKERHIFPAPSMYTSIAIDLQNGKCALSFACGSRTNRDSAIEDGYVIAEENKNVPLKRSEDIDGMKLGNTHINLGVYRRDQKAWSKENFRASDALFLDLEMMYSEGEHRGDEGGKKNAGKYTAEEAVSRLANMRNMDGSRKYSYRVGNANGPLPTVAYVKAKFSERKREGAKVHISKSGKDKFSAMDFEVLKSHFPPSIICKRYVLSKLLEIDDKLKFGGTDGEYANIMNDEELQLECRNRKLPDSVNEEALRILLKAHEVEKHTESNGEELRASSRITDGEEIRANAGALRFKGVADQYSSMELSELKKSCSDLFQGEKLTKDFIMMNLLKVDDIFRVGEVEIQYDAMSNADLEVEFRERNLPLANTKIALQILLRGNLSLSASDTSGFANMSAAQHRLMNK